MLARNLAAGEPMLEALKRSGSYLGPMAALAVVAYMPWYLDFSSQASGIYPYVGAGTTPAHAFDQWGTADRRGDARARCRCDETTRRPSSMSRRSRSGCRCCRSRRGRRWRATTARSAKAWTRARSPAGGRSRFTASASSRSRSAAAVLFARRSMAAIPAALGATGILLLYGSELLFIRDVFFGSVPRLNTVFKLSYQAWVLLSIGGAVSIACRLRAGIAVESRAGGAAFASLLVLVASIYALTGIPNRTNGFANEGSVDGLAGLARFDPDEYALVTWINENTAPGIGHPRGDGPELEHRQRRQPGHRRPGHGLHRERPHFRAYGPADGHRLVFPRGAVARRCPGGSRPSSRSARPAVDDALPGRRGLGEGARRRWTASACSTSWLGVSNRPSILSRRCPNSMVFLDLVFESGGLRIYAVPAMKVVPTS